MTLSQQERAKLLQYVDEHVTLSNDMKQTVIDAKIRTLTALIKRLLLKKDTTIEILVMKGKAD
jgi:hypothetical protein